MHVRIATGADREFILGLAARFAEFDLPAWRSRDDVVGGTARQLERGLAGASERSSFLIAEDDGERAGFAWIFIERDFYTDRDVAKISEIAVARDGLGAGEALLDAAQEWARERACHLIVLNVMDGNIHARRFYERHGFAAEYAMLAKDLRRD